MKKFLATWLCALMLISCTANIEYIVLLNDGVNNKEIRFNNISTIIIPDVEREGYDLISIHDSNGEVYKSGDFVLINNNMTLTWEWTKLNKIILSSNGQEEIRWIKPNTEFEIPKKSYDGYILSSITDADGNFYQAGEIVSPTKDLELTYNWEKLINKYTVTIISDGKVYSSESIDKGKAYTIPSIDNENYRLVSILDGSGFKYTPGSDLIINDNITLIYNWEKVSTKYTITIKNYGTIETITVAENDIFTIPDKIRSGHAIETITDNFGNSYKPGQTVKVRADLSLTYNWIKLIDKYTVTILSDGKIISNQILTKGVPFTIPTLTKEGHQLVSVLDETGSKLIPGTEISISDNLTLIYNWQLKDCNITIISNDVKQNYTVTYGSPFTLPEKYLEGNGLVSITDTNGNSYTAGNTITVTEDMTISYNWAPIESKYTLSVINDGNLVDTIVNRGYSFLLEPKVKEGYRLRNITDNYGKTYTPGESVVIISDIVFTYNWQKVWTVTESHNGTTYTYTVDDESYHNTKLHKDGYELRSITGSNGVDYTKENNIKINSDLTLSYDWAKIHTVTINGNGAPIELSIADDRTLELNKINPGFRLESIMGSDGNDYTNESSITVNSDLTLTYNWIKQYKVHFEGTTLPDSFVDKGTTVSIPSYEKRGYYLDSITDKKSNVAYSAGSNIEITDDTTISWNWLQETPASDFEYIDDGEEVTITKLLNPETHDVIIPAYINNHPVTKLMGDVFQYKSIDSLIMPNSITYFAITRIPDEIKKIILSDSLTTINDYDFEGRNQLQEIHLPKNLKHINRQAFHGCTSLSEITLPEGLISIEKWAFEECKSLKSITIPSTVTTIGEAAFSGCTKLMSINIPETVSNISESAFSGCPGEWSIPEVVYINWEEIDNGISIKSYVGKSTYLEIPEYISGKKVLAIDSYCYMNNIETLILPSTLKTINNEALGSNLKTVFVPNSVEYVGSNAFNNIQQILIEKGVNTLNWESNWNEHMNPLNIIFDIYKQGNYVAKEINTSELKIIQNLGMHPHAQYNVPSSIEGKTVVEIGNDVFSGRSDMKHITLPSTIRTIGDRAFAGCTNLKSIELPTELEIINQYAFQGCSSLYSFDLPSKVREINDYALSHCINLKSIKIPESLEKIGNYAFYDDRELTEVILNEGLISIGEYAFSTTPSLKVIYLPNKLETVGYSLFYSSNPLISIYVGKNNNMAKWNGDWNMDNYNRRPYKLITDSSCIPLQK